MVSDTAAFYDRFPFPQYDVGEVRNRAEQMRRILLEEGALSSDFLKCARILDAGCGTGTISNALALALPDARVTGINISSLSCDYARAQATRMGLTNVTYWVADLFKIPAELKQPPFDLIVSVGVLHHTPDATAGLDCLLKIAAPRCCLVLSLYHLGRYKIAAQRLILSALAGRHAERRLKAAKRLFPRSCTAHLAKYRGTDEDAALADKYCVPRETYHSYVGIARHLRRHAFEIVATSPFGRPAPGPRTRAATQLLRPFTSEFLRPLLVQDLLGLYIGREQFTVIARNF